MHRARGRRRAARKPHGRRLRRPARRRARPTRRGHRIGAAPVRCHAGRRGRRADVAGIRRPRPDRAVRGHGRHAGARHAGARRVGSRHAAAAARPAAAATQPREPRTQASRPPPARRRSSADGRGDPRATPQATGGPARARSHAAAAACRAGTGGDTAAAARDAAARRGRAAAQAGRAAAAGSVATAARAPRPIPAGVAAEVGGNALRRLGLSPLARGAGRPPAVRPRVGRRALCPCDGAIKLRACAALGGCGGSCSPSFPSGSSGGWA
jgi:hypothetical protein